MSTPTLRPYPIPRYVKGNRTQQLIPMGRYWESAPRESWPDREYITPASTPMRRLSPVELATLRITANRGPWEVPPVAGMAGEAAVRAAWWVARGDFRTATAHDLARHLQDVFFPRSSLARRPWRGYQLLLEMDAIGDLTGVEVWLDTVDPGDWRRFAAVRLRDRVAELLTA